MQEHKYNTEWDTAELNEIAYNEARRKKGKH